MNLKLGKDVAVEWLLSVNKKYSVNNLVIDLVSPEKSIIEVEKTIELTEVKEKDNVYKISFVLPANKQTSYGIYPLVIKDNNGVQLESINALNLVKHIDEPVAIGNATRDIKTLSIDTEYIPVSEDEISTVAEKTVDEKLKDIDTVKFEIVDELPESGETATFYLVKDEESEGQDQYSEYIYVNGSWEKMGLNKVNLEDYAKKEYVDTSLDGLKLKKLTQSEYDALSVKDNSTLYVIVD